MGAILNDGQPEFFGHFQDAVHIGRTSKPVHGHDHSRAGSDLPPGVDWIQRVRIQIEVGKHGNRVLEQNSVGSGKEGERGHDHLVAGADVKGIKGCVLGIGSGAEGDHIPSPDHVLECRFQLEDFLRPSSHRTKDALLEDVEDPPQLLPAISDL